MLATAAVLAGAAAPAGADAKGDALHCEAARRYDEAVQLGSVGAEERTRAARAAVEEWKKCLGGDDSAEKVRAEGREALRQPRDMPESARKLLAAIDRYLQYAPHAPERLALEYRRARILYEYHRFAEAMPLFRAIAGRHPRDPLAIYSANLLFDCEAVINRLDLLEADVKKLCAVPELARDREFARQCSVIQVGLARRQIESWEKEGKRILAANGYLALARKHPDDPRLDELYYNAAVLLERADAPELAIRVYQELLGRKPDSVLAKKSLFVLGRIYEEQDELAEASKYYEMFAARFPGEREAPESLRTAFQFRARLGQTKKAIEIADFFVKLYGPRKNYADQCAGLMLEVADVQGKLGDRRGQEKQLRRYLKDWGARGGVDREIVANAALGELVRVGEAQRFFGEAVRLYADGAAERRILARSEEERNARIERMRAAVARARERMAVTPP